MIVVGYDPVEGAVFARADGEPPCWGASASGLTVKHYQQAGILYLELNGDEVSLLFFDLSDRPIRPTLERYRGGWRVTTRLKSQS